MDFLYGASLLIKVTGDLRVPILISNCGRSELAHYLKCELEEASENFTRSGMGDLVGG